MSEVLALKYRPSSFDKLIGQESVRVTLTSALDSKRLSHAYLFSGLRGSGKTSTARIFAKALLCEKGETSSPCESCENCKMANEGRHIDIIEMDGASSRKIDDIRGLIEQTKYKPNMARYKIFIIDEVHMLTREAFNALLKTLEEPPEFVKFILATTDPLKLPATILSRTQHFRFKKIASADVIKHISHILNLEGIEYEDEALKILTRAGNGSLRDTLTLLDQAIIYTNGFIDTKSVASMLGVLDPEFFQKLVDSILAKDKNSILGYIKELEEYEAEVILDEFISYLKDSFLNEDSRFSLMLIDRFFRILSESKNLLQFNTDNTFVLTLTFFKMIEATKLKEIDSMIEELESTLSVKKPLATPSTHDAKTPNIQTKTTENSFEKLKKLLYDRNYELGECFEKSINFVSFENDNLQLTSSADESCKEILRKSSSIIKHFVKECYTIDTVISITPITPQQHKEDDDLKKNSEPKEQVSDNQNQSSSCVADNVVGEKEELNPQNLLEDPFVTKAQELFQPKKIIVRSKV
jgi:DNA polymerase-3 subunit gamma/tau